MPSWSARTETVELLMPCCSAYVTRRVDFAENGAIKRIQRVPQKCKECNWVFGEEEQDALKHQLHELVRDLKGDETDEDEDTTDRFIVKRPRIPMNQLGEYDD